MSKNGYTKFTSKHAVSNPGLNDSEVEKSRLESGANVLGVVKGKSFLRHFLSNLGDPVIKILLAALVINLIFVFRGGDWVETAGIAASVFLATFISTLSERGSENAFRRLSEECTKDNFRVRRNGKVCEIPIADIVVGDVVLIGAGEQIPADGHIISGKISVDQSSMTGENKEAEKYPVTGSAGQQRDPSSPGAVFRGSPVLSGEAEIKIFAVGDKTFLGEISREVQLRTRESPLKIRLTKLAKQISRLGYIAAVLVAVATLFNTFFIDSAFDMRLVALKFSDISYVLENLLHAFMLGLTVIVVAVPEGLPMMIAVVLSSNTRRMIKDNVLVRKPVGIEAAGSMNILFTDKTGTLTEGKLSVGRIVTADCSSYTNYADFAQRCGNVASLYALSCRQNTSAVFDGNTGRPLGGNTTDRALLESVGKGDTGDYERISVIPFDSEIKYSAVTVCRRSSPYVKTVLIKGAPEKLLPSVMYCYDKNGRICRFSQYASGFTAEIAKITSSGGRVLLIAEGNEMPYQNRIGELTLICCVLLCDRIRAEAKRSVRELHEAGIHVIMMTGDNRDTAESIAEKCGIISGKSKLVITGDELRRLSDMRVSELLPEIAVIARSLPADKSRLVRIAQEKGLVVGMTGDGVNDAPALKRADIGFAMGNGTQVARDAGDIIILDNNLASIAKSVLHGRNIFKSIRKFIVLQLTMNFCAVGVSMIGPFIGFDAPVTVVQMLWINIIMDTLGGLAFAGEAALPGCMKEKPKRRDEPILNGYMISQIVFLGSFTVGICLAFLKLPGITSHFRAASDNIYLLTAFFALFIFSSVFNCFNSRTDRLSLFAGISRNKAFLAIMGAVCTIQILFVYLGGSVLRTAPLTASELLYTMALSLLVFPFEFLRKLLRRLFGKKEGF